MTLTILVKLIDKLENRVISVFVNYNRHEGSLTIALWLEVRDQRLTEKMSLRRYQRLTTPVTSHWNHIGDVDVVHWVGARPSEPLVNAPQRLFELLSTPRRPTFKHRKLKTKTLKELSETGAGGVGYITYHQFPCIPLFRAKETTRRLLTNHFT